MVRDGLSRLSGPWLGSPWVISMALMMVLAFFPGRSAQSIQRMDKTSPRRVVEFLYVDPKALKVSVVGSFNDWAPNAHVMENKGDWWSLEILLPPGRYEYAFLIDDRIWKADPLSLVKEKNGFDELNSILILE
jgi:1,4-alpha-glucan branching enzyme